MTTSEKKDIPEKTDAEPAGIEEHNLSDATLEDVTGGCCGDDGRKNAAPKAGSRPDKWGGMTR